MITTDAELNRLVAERVLKYWVYHYDKDYRPNQYYVLFDEEMNTVAPFNRADGIRSGYRQTEAEAWADVPDYCTDPAAWGALFVRLAEQGRCPSLEYDGLGTFVVAVGKSFETAILPGRALVLATLAAYGVEVE